MKAVVDIKLYATLAAHAPPGAEAYTVADGIRVRELAQDLGIDLTLVKLVFINGIKKDLDARLQDGDRVGIFPPVGGG